MNKKEVLSNAFLHRLAEGKSIKYKEFRLDDSLLLSRIEKEFGGITKCAEYCGITKQELISKYGMGRKIYNSMLTDDEILERLMYLKSIGKLNTNNMRTQFDDLRLEYSLKKKYGSVKNALEFYNLERDTKLVNYEKLVSQIKELEINNYDLSYNNILKTKPTLLYNITNKTKLSWYNSLKLLNIKYIPLKSEKYDRDTIDFKLKEIIEKEGSISYSILRNKYSGLLSYVRSNYNSIYNFYEDFGYDPVKLMDFKTQRIKGFMFERIFKDILDKLNIKYQYNKYLNNNTIRPDFILNDDTIIDCKLSSWTSSIEDTFNKYKEVSKKVIIVYLRGLDDYCTINDSKFEMRSVDYYLNMLNDEDKLYFKGKLEYILNNDNFIETVTTERTSV
jgi:hypothetical protein